MARDAQTLALLTLLGAGFLAIRRGVALVPGATVLSADQVCAFMQSVLNLSEIDADADMVLRVAFIESSFNPSAVRAEPQINDASTGLMQTLVSTAQWLHDDMGFKSFGRPTLTSLKGAQESLYYGAAYLTYLKTWRGQARGEEFIVRGYNGGPGGASSSATLPYWRKYQDARDLRCR